jgi:PadR family transcriptional regulator
VGHVGEQPQARFYTLTKKGRKELVHEQSEWRRIASAIMRVLGPRRAER